MKKQFLLTAALGFLPLQTVCAISVDKYKFNRVDVAKGLSNSEEKCIYKDKTGFTWFGTPSGLSGEIRAESVPEGGARFVVELPCRNETDLPPASEENGINEEEAAFEAEFKQNASPKLLIVEDNKDLVNLIASRFKDHYTILQAGDGAEGLETALKEIPDIILSDVMTPHMDGIEMRKHNQALFGEQIRIEPSKIIVNSLDKQLIKRVLEYTEANISNPNFSVEELSRELGMSRVHLYKKLSSLSGKTPIEFIRIIRLKRAAQLLQESRLTVSEIAYEVGFNNPRYFRKYFKDEFGVLPSQYGAPNE